MIHVQTWIEHGSSLEGSHIWSISNSVPKFQRSIVTQLPLRLAINITSICHYYELMMDSMMDNTSSGSAMMIPYLHFVTGDYLYFKTWQPTSAGAIAGACIALVVLALLERWLAATRGVLDLHWRQRALSLTASTPQYSTAEDMSFTHEDNDKSPGVQEVFQKNANAQKTINTRARHSRTITPFIIAHDIPRGILYSLQMLLMYILMLAVMTFQAAFLISVILGLGIGEILFGRLVGRIPVH